MKKLLKQLLCLMLTMAMVAAVPVGAAAIEGASMELHSICLKNKYVNLQGRIFDTAEERVELWQNGSVLDSTVSAVDGSFAFFAATAPGKLSVTSQSGAVGDMDFSAFSSLFGLEGDSYHSLELTMEYKRFCLTGKHGGEGIQHVTMRMLTPEGDAAAVVETKSDAEGSFAFEFYLKPGSYTFQLKARKLPLQECTLTLADYNLVPLEEIDADDHPLIVQLNRQLRELESLRGYCQTKGLTTDYEDVNIEMIRKFIGFIHEEIAAGYTGSLSQYEAALTGLYTQAKESLTAYLLGEKKPFAVPHYVTSDLTFDGTTVYADTILDGKTENRPVFFNGFGHFDTANNDTEFFNSIGINTIQSALPSMAGCFQTDDWADDWNGHRIGESAGTFTETNNGIAEGEHSILVVNTDARGIDAFTYMNQTISVKPNTYYMYGFRAKGKAEDANSLNVCINDVFTGTRKPIAPSDTWIDYQFLHKTENEDTMTINFVSQYNTEGMYLDDVYVKEVDTNTNLLKNGDFEKAARPLTDLDREAMAEGYYIRYNSVENFRRVLSEAEKNNVLVDVGVFPHFFPPFLEQGTQEDYTDDGLNEMHFTPFELDNERVRKAISIYARLVGSIISEYDCVASVCLMNEPGLVANKVTETKDLKTHYMPRWHAYLKELYNNDIEKLNKNYATSYRDFTEVDMPDNMEATPLYYDFRCFNDSVLTEFHQWFADVMHKAYPEFKIHSKVQQYLRGNYESYLERGTNYELLHPYLDINGCDSFPTYNVPTTSLSFKNAFYDMLTSLKEAPVWDTEVHVLTDGKTISYYQDQISAVEADVWSGAIHGRGAGVYWLWDRSSSTFPWTNGSYTNANYGLRPEEAATIARTNLDLNRLSREVSALQNAKAKSAILYSRTSSGYNTASMDELLKGYEALLFGGQKVEFITDSTPQKIHDYQLVVIPEATHVKPELLTEIRKYLNNGGTVYLQGEDSLKKTEYDKDQNAAQVEEIYKHPHTVTETESTIGDTIRNLELSKVQVVDAKTGGAIDGVEWFFTKEKGRYLIHAINHDKEENKTVKLLYQGSPVTEFEELRKGAVVSEITLKPYEPVLLSFETFTFDLVDEDGTILEKNIQTLKPGRIRCNTVEEGDLILALYKDDALLDVKIHSNVIEFSQMEDGNYRIMAAVWDMESMTPLTECRKMTN